MRSPRNPHAAGPLRGPRSLWVSARRGQPAAPTRENLESNMAYPSYLLRVLAEHRAGRTRCHGRNNGRCVRAHDNARIHKYIGSLFRLSLHVFGAGWTQCRFKQKLGNVLFNNSRLQLPGMRSIPFLKPRPAQVDEFLLLQPAVVIRISLFEGGGR
jgi:hypothetical protein